MLSNASTTVHLQNTEISDEMGEKWEKSESFGSLFLFLEENNNNFGRFYQLTFHETFVPLQQSSKIKD